MMPHFISPCDLTPLPDGRTWRLDAAFGFWSPLCGYVTVPAGFVTDLASVPRLFWDILPPFGTYTRATVVHDYLYRTQLLPRDKADRILLQAMVACGTGLLARTIIYWNVRWFGEAAWLDDSRHLPKPKHVEHYGGKHYLHS